MESPSSRALRLLGLLQTGRAWTGPELAARLGVSERSVRRDAARLRDLGYDVTSRPGPGSGYRLRPGTRVPPLLLDADEVATIVTGLLVVEAWSPDDASVRTARTKLEQVLPPGLRRRAEATALATQVLGGAGAPVDGHLLGVLADAVAGGAHVAFTYTDRHGRVSRRTVDPHRHVLREGHWYLVGLDVDRADWRVYRLDRVDQVTVVPGPHAPHDFPHVSIDEWLGSDFGRRSSRRP